MNVYLRNITNSFQDVRLVSLSSWRKANEISPRDHGGPYVVLQEGFDPEDATVTADEFILGRSGKWLSLGLFYRMPVAERREEFVFGTAAEVMQMMGNLPSKVVMLRLKPNPNREPATSETDELADAIRNAKAPAR